MAKQHSNPSDSKSDSAILFLQEMLVDVFGIIIPGFCFLVLAAVALAIPLVDLAREIGSIEYIFSTKKVLEKNTLAIFLTLSIFSFVVGHLLYRRDPKIPDLHSIRSLSDEDLKAGCVREIGNEREQFPYGFLKEYLADRGFSELALLIHWTGADFAGSAREKEPGKGASLRSKHFINLIKLQIKQNSSSLYFEIIRNEAHVRLISSVWHAARALMFLSALGIALGVAANVSSSIKAHCLQLAHIEAILFPLVVLLCNLWTMLSIQKFFHYQRVREIVFVLQAWHLTQQAGPVAQNESSAMDNSPQSRSPAAG
jgi:hypothetical protein